jgi:hypothetical protein
MNWKQTIFALVTIIILGTGLRFFGLDNNSLVSDEFLDMNSAYGYAQTGEWKAWDFNFGRLSEVNINVPRDERAVVYKWQVAQVLRFLPPTETVARSVSVFWGIISIGAIFWAAHILTRRKEIALIAALFFAVSVSGIIFDRTLRMYAMFFPLYLIASTFTFLALERAYAGKMRFCVYVWEKLGIHIHFALAAAGFFILAILTHQLAGTLIFSLAIYLIARALQAYRQNGNLYNKYFVLLILKLAGVMAVAFLAPRFFRSFAGGLIFFDDHYSYVSYVLRDYYHPLLAILLMLFGGWWIAKRENMPKESLWISLSLIVPLAMAIWLWRRNIGVQYIFFAQSFAIILVASGVFGFWTLVCEKWQIAPAQKKALLILGLLIILVPNFGYFVEENNTYHETSSGGNPNYRKVFTYFKQHHIATDVLVTRNGRNYYFSGANVPVYDLGDEISKTRLSQENLEKLMTEYPTGWVILSDNDYDYVSKGVKEFLAKNLTRVSNDQVRGAIDVYTWGR